MKKITFAVILIIIIGLLVFFFTKGNENNEVIVAPETSGTEAGDEDPNSGRYELEDKDTKADGETLLGTSVDGKEIKAFHYGDLTASKEFLIIGGIHGSYSRNTVTLANELMNYFENNDTVIPEGYVATVIPVMNPDGYAKSSVSKTIAGRFNANDVDLNRNFDCQWSETSKWQNRDVSGGDAPFSEPEARAIQAYVAANKIEAAVVYYAAAGGVFASNCSDAVLSQTLKLTNTYAKASGYEAFESFDFYEISGDMVNWFAKNNIPAISVLLSGYESTEFSKNKAGIDAFFAVYK
jgi:hypothetical protein